MAQDLFHYMSDDEYTKFLERQRKEKLLSSLKKSTTDFSVKQVPKRSKEEPELVDPIEDKKITKKIEELADSYNIQEKGILSEDSWSRMVEQFEFQMDPFSDIAEREQYQYKSQWARASEEDDDYYDKRFSKEYSLLHALLSQVEKDSKAVEKKIKEMITTKKAGIGKYTVVDLWGVANSMHTTKLQTIKEIAGIKKTASELKLKELKNNPPEANSVDSAASNYYDNIIKNGRKNFVQALSSNADISRSSQDTTDYSDGDDIAMPLDDDIQVSPLSALTSNMNNVTRDGYVDEDEVSSYIELENKGVQVYIQRFDDGELAFCALDKDGREVIGYELPNPALLDTLQIRPDSNYTYDELGRKYKIIDFSNSYEEVDINQEMEDEYY